MKKILISALLLTCLLLGVEAQSPELGDMVEVSLLTCRSGDELYSTFGHTALRVRNEANSSDIVFNYGVFDFDAPYFYIKFLRGLLPYRLSATTMERFLRNYNYERRSVIEQKLALTTAQKTALLEALAENIKPENATYKYDFFFDNCTTRTEDVVRSITGTITYSKPLADVTFRQMLKPNLTSLPWSEFGIDLIIGAVADQKASRNQQHFLPLYLYADVKEATIVIDKARKNLAATDYLVLDFEMENEQRKTPATNWPLIITALLLLAEIAASWLQPTGTMTRLYDKAWFILLAMMSVVMGIMWWGTEHMATKQNYNLLWANILYIPYLLVGRSIVKRGLASVILLCSAAALANSIYQFLPQYFLPSFGVIAAISIVKLIRGWSMSSTTQINIKP